MGNLLTSCVPTVHQVLRLVRIRPLALRREFLLAVHAFSAGDLEGGNNTVANVQTSHSRAHRFDLAAEFVAENIAFLHLDDGA